MRSIFRRPLCIGFIVFAIPFAGKLLSARAQSAAVATKMSAKRPSDKHPATLVQLMRGIMFPNSNLVFAAQGKDPATASPAKNPSSAINPLEGTYGKWEAVENSSLAMVEAADLLTVSGRVCSNGRPVPTTNSDWPGLVQGLRAAGMKAYRAAQAKDQDKITDAADALTAACGNCHTKYRDKARLEDRCR